MGCPRRNELPGELHRLLNGLQEVSEKHGGGADEGLSIVGLDLARRPSSRDETSESGKKPLVVKSDVGSRWMAFVEKQTKTNTYHFV